MLCIPVNANTVDPGSFEMSVSLDKESFTTGPTVMGVASVFYILT